MEINTKIVLSKEDLKNIISLYVKEQFGKQVANISIDLDAIPKLDSQQCTPIFKSITINIKE